VCNLYQAVNKARLRALLPQVRIPDWAEWHESIAPLRAGPFVRPGADDGLDAVVGQWGMIPLSSKTRTPMTSKGTRMSTNNCRRETMAKAWTFSLAWKRGQRCLIPAESYDEPYWGTGKNIWWRFRRADGMPWMLAGLWSEWKDLETGEIVPSYTMITQNCDAHPLLKLMHKPDPKLPADQQDKRSVVPIEPGAWDAWLRAPVEEAEKLIGLPTMECIRHGAADPDKDVALPI
jgi:putative SOS response-associated peptidase YedK